MTLALSNHLAPSAMLQFCEPNQAFNFSKVITLKAFEMEQSVMGGISHSTLPGAFRCFQGTSELTHVHASAKKARIYQKHDSDSIIEISMQGHLLSLHLFHLFSRPSSVTCKLLQVLLKFFHLLPDRLHLASMVFFLTH